MKAANKDLIISTVVSSFFRILKRDKNMYSSFNKYWLNTSNIVSSLPQDMKEYAESYLDVNYTFLKRDGSVFEYVVLVINCLLPKFIRMTDPNFDFYMFGESIFDATCTKLYGADYKLLIQKFVEENNLTPNKHS